MADIHQILTEASTPPNKEQELKDAQAQEIQRIRHQELKELREHWAMHRFSVEILSQIETRELNCRQEAAALVAQGNTNNDLLRSKIMESLVLARVAGLMTGVIEKL